MTFKFFIVMGVAGSGKSRVGQALATRLGWDFYDADDFHPPENVAKMQRGIPLDDESRVPWLAALHDLISACLAENRPGVLACSALKERYRQQLMERNAGVRLVYLKGSYDLILSRLQARAGHFMKPNMLRSQFETLEEPANALTVDVAPSVDEIVETIVLSSSV
jgi:gluconokinase